MEPLRIGIVGCGNISGIYFQNLNRYRSTTVAACADLDLDRAKAAAEKYGVAKAQSPDELLANPDIELVLNLTVPKAHASVALQAVRSGKHVYNEKPLTVTVEESAELLREAETAGVRVGSAPDTFLGGGHQLCRALIDDGAIGEPVAANAFMLCRGHETWHPSPEFYYEVGGGPMMDMGPYYLTALVNMLGPIRRVAGSTRISFPTRTITSQPKHGKVVDVETATHIAGTIDFAQGAVAQMTTSFDVFGSPLDPIAVYGKEGTLLVPDPNGFGGVVKLYRPGQSDWEEIPLRHGFSENGRGVGVLDMAHAIRLGRPHRASGALAAHVLQAMHAFQESSDAGAHALLTSTLERPVPMAEAEYADELVEATR
jgi:predicted dehydrogenase